MISSRLKTPTRWSISGTVDEQFFFLTLGQTARDDHAAQVALLFELEHFVDRGERLVTGLFDKAAGVDDREVGPFRVVDQVVSVDLQHAEHPFAVDEVFGATEADKGIGSLCVRAVFFGGVGIGHGNRTFTGGGSELRRNSHCSRLGAGGRWARIPELFQLGLSQSCGVLAGDYLTQNLKINVLEFVDIETCDRFFVFA